MTDWNIYGNVIRIYKGSGNLHFAEDEISCEFELVQLANGNLYAKCQILDPIKAFLLRWADQQPDKLVGETENGQLLTFFENLIIVSVKGNEIVVSGNFAKTKFLEPEKPVCLKFALVNLMHQSQMELNCNGYNLVIKSIENYGDVILGLKASKGIAVTSEASISLDSATEVEKAVHILNDICLLLTLSQGCRVAWLYYEVVEQEGRVAESFHGSAITKPFTNIPLIPPQDTEGYLKIAYPHLPEQKEFWKLKKAIDAYTDAKVEGDFLEARALKLVILMEHLKARYLKEKNKEFILNPPQAFDESADDLINDVKRVLISKFPNSEQDELEMMANHVKGLNRFPFSRALSEMCKDIGLQVNSRERRHFIEIRNELVHRFEFHTDYGNVWKQFSYLMDFIGRMFLAILKYNDYYYDWTKLEKGQEEMRIKLNQEIEKV